MNAAYGGRAVFQLNRYADETPEEFAQKRLLPKRRVHLGEDVDVLDTRGTDVGALPASFDWTAKGAVSSVKNQGSAGTCWAFSTAAALEGQWFLKHNQLFNLSVEQMVDCDGAVGTNGRDACCGVFGGWPYLSYDWIKSVGGLQTWESYPYCSGGEGPEPTCYPCYATGANETLCGPEVPNCSRHCQMDTSKAVATVDSWQQVAGNMTDMMGALVSTGPLSILVDATEMQFYKHGVLMGKFCSEETDHAVLLTGYGAETDGTLWWKIKNSWGADWGEDGYVRLLRSATKDVCGIDTGVTVPSAGAPPSSFWHAMPQK